MARVEGWEVKLYDAIEAARQKPFIWGENDCVCWSMAVVEAITGKDYFEPFRGTYSNELGAQKTIKRLAPDLVSVVGIYFDEQPVLMAHRGDLMMHQGGLGICDGIHSHFITEQGLTSIKTVACTHSWRVG